MYAWMTRTPQAMRAFRSQMIQDLAIIRQLAESSSVHVDMSERSLVNLGTDASLSYNLLALEPFFEIVRAYPDLAQQVHFWNRYLAADPFDPARQIFADFFHAHSKDRPHSTAVHS